MAVPKETVWEADPHTLAKHAILREYLQAWFPILGSTQGRVIYLDGFAGPGEYKGGEPGSPVIALKVATQYHSRFKGEAIFYFIDEDCKRIAHLDGKLEGFMQLSKFKIKTECAEFEQVLTKALDDLDAGGHQIAPTFAFIDPFGFKGLPMKLIHRLLAHEKTEAFINFNLNNINRFVESPDPKIRARITDLFGTEEVIEIIRGTSSRHSSLRALYRHQLGKAASYVRFFSMNDGSDRPIYDLFFAGNHPLGHYRMKKAMWKVDPQSGLRFSDATDPNQALLFEADPAPQLLPLILRRYGQRQDVVVQEIIDWIRNETAFLEPHMRAALRQGEAEERLRILERHTDGSKRRRGSFTPKAVIDFTWRPAAPQGSLF